MNELAGSKFDQDLSNLYPVPRENYEFHTTAQGSHLFYAIRGTGPDSALGMNALNSWVIPDFTAHYLKYCDGLSTHSQIVERAYSDVSPIFREIQARRAVMALIKETNVLSFENDSSASMMMNTGDFDSFAPLHASIEITDACNYVCDHCYVSASPWKQSKRDGRDLLKLLDFLRNSGVKVLELTGGECTIHPDFMKVLTKASELFHLVAVVSNGWRIGKRDNLAQFISSHANVVTQISIDGMEAFHDEFRGRKGAFAAACEAVRKLRAYGTVVRLAMTVTWDNLQYVEDVIRLAKSLDASTFSLAPVTSFGRAGEKHLAGSCADSDHKLMHEIQKALIPYADDPLFDTNKMALQVQEDHGEINCGAGWRSFALNGATGEVRSCLFLVDSKKFGSVDRQSYDDIFKSPYMKLFKNAPSPSQKLATCQDCEFIAICVGCFAKAFKTSEQYFDNGMCPWRLKYFPGMPLEQNDSENIIEVKFGEKPTQLM